MLTFERQCVAIGLPTPTPEYRFHPTRRWRFDFAWPHHKLALEVEGGVFIRGRHSRGAGMVKDMEKYGEAAILGWRVLRVTPKQVRDGSALTLVERAFVLHGSSSPGPRDP
jgi:very-short-patch-repair endonuclease